MKNRHNIAEGFKFIILWHPVVSRCFILFSIPVLFLPLTLFSSYTCTFATIEKNNLKIQNPQANQMTLITLIGLSAAILTTGAYIPQAYKTIKTKSTSGLSLSTFLMLFVGTILWFIYGIYINDLPIILANGITATLSGIIFYLKITIKAKVEN